MYILNVFLMMTIHFFLSCKHLELIGMPPSPHVDQIFPTHQLHVDVSIIDYHNIFDCTSIITNEYSKGSVRDFICIDLSPPLSPSKRASLYSTSSDGVSLSRFTRFNLLF